VFKGVDAVGKRIDMRQLPEGRRHGRDRIHGAGQEEHGHDEKIHDDVKAVERGKPRGDEYPHGGDAERDEGRHRRDLDELHDCQVNAEQGSEDQDDDRLGN